MVKTPKKDYYQKENEERCLVSDKINHYELEQISKKLSLKAEPYIKKKNPAAYLFVNQTYFENTFACNKVSHKEKENNIPSTFYYNQKLDGRKNSGDSNSDSTNSDENFNEKAKRRFKGEAKDFKIKYKTELCKTFEMKGQCKYGNKCAYAHGIEELRSKVTNTTAYRTKKCVQFFEQGYCPYGNRCQFAHQLKTNISNNPYDRNMTYCKIMETISKPENINNIKKLVDKPRLSVFRELAPNNENSESRLLDDIKMLTQTYEKLISHKN